MVVEEKALIADRRRSVMISRHLFERPLRLLPGYSQVF